MELKVYHVEIDPNPLSELEVNFMGLVDKPAIQRNFLSFKDKAPAQFTINDDKRILCGPAMIPDLAIYRRDEEMGEYAVVFKAEQIRSISEKFASKGYMNNLNLFHDDARKVSDAVIFNSFISDDTIGVPAMAGFEDLPQGTWFISVKVNNDDAWERVKKGEIKGFSVEGLFTYKPQARKITMSLQELQAAIERLVESVEIV